MGRKFLHLLRHNLLVRASSVIVIALAVVFSSTFFIHALSPSVTGSVYRLYANANSTTPGTPLAATNTSAQLGNSGDAFRLRAGLTTRDNAVNISTVYMGNAAACAIASGIVYCEGLNSYGELGNGTTTASYALTPVSTTTGMSGPISVIDMNTKTTTPYTCAVSSGALYCWGVNTYGNLGVNQSSTALTSTTTPMAVYTGTGLAGKTVTALGLGDGHACAIASGVAYCWGTGGNGRNGANNTTAYNAPNPVYTGGVLSGKTLTDVGSGSGSSCVLDTSGQAYCWGSNGAGALGNASTTDVHAPVAVDTSGVLSGKTLIDITVGNNTACAVATDGKAYCWGDDTYGQTGNGVTTTTPYSSPIAVDTSGALAGKTLIGISEGASSTCAVASDGSVYCWGNGGSGVLGNNHGSGVYNTPQQVVNTGVLAGEVPNSINIGGSSACVSATDGKAFCWGNNSSGQLGIGSTSPSTSSVPTTMLLTNIAAGDGVTLATSAVSDKLQFAQKTGATCSVQTTGFADVTTTSAIAWNTNAGVTNGATISSSANDPTSTGGNVYESYQSAAGNFTNGTAITPGKTGLWDFSLKDNSGLYNTSYCLRLTVSGTPGTAHDGYIAYPEIKTAPGTLSLDIVDGSGVTVPNPSFPLSSTIVKTTCQSTTGYLGTSTQQLQVTNNVATNGWNLSVAATGGSTAKWTSPDTSAQYDYNDPSGSPAGCNSGSDGDGLAGQLSVNGGGGGVTYGTGCSGTGVTFGVSSAFNQGTVDAITLLNGSSTSQMYCPFGRQYVPITQTIPASQPAGNYSMDLMLTVVAQ